MDIKINSATNFKSGITSQILRMEKNINPRQVENYFRNLPEQDPRSFYNIDFKNNKAIATANRLCADIFKNLRKIFDYRAGYCTKSLVTPQDLYVYNREDSDFYNGKSYFAIECDIGIEEKFFQKGTVFMHNEINKLEDLNDWAESFYQKNKVSTPHFMNAFIHEWLHSIFCKTLDDFCFNEEFHFNRTQDKYHLNKLTKKEKEIVSDIISTYPTSDNVSQYAETFAESWTKFICESLADDCRTFKKNPLDLVRATPKEFQKILKKVSIVKCVEYGTK